MDLYISRMRDACLRFEYKEEGVQDLRSSSLSARACAYDLGSEPGLSRSGAMNTSGIAADRPGTRPKRATLHFSNLVSCSARRRQGE